MQVIQKSQTPITITLIQIAVPPLIMAAGMGGIWGMVGMIAAAPSMEEEVMEEAEVGEIKHMGCVAV